MVMVSKFSNFPDELKWKWRIKEYELRRFDCAQRSTDKLVHGEASIFVYESLQNLEY